MIEFLSIPAGHALIIFLTLWVLLIIRQLFHKKIRIFDEVDRTFFYIQNKHSRVREPGASDYWTSGFVSYDPKKHGVKPPKPISDRLKKRYAAIIGVNNRRSLLKPVILAIVTYMVYHNVTTI
jgi:hypothetical protein